MIIYSVTVSIDASIREEWISWMKQVHIPEVMATGYFHERTMQELLDPPPQPGSFTFNIQYTCKTIEEYEAYHQGPAEALQSAHTMRYKDKFVAFRTLLRRFKTIQGFFLFLPIIAKKTIMTKNLTGLFLIALLSLFACKSQQSGAGTDGSMEFIKVSEGSSCGVEEPSNQLITTADEWRTLWKSVGSNRMPAPPVPEVNFEENYLVASFLGNRNNGGYSVSVTDMSLNNGTLSVSVLETKPGTNCFVTDAITQPYIIVSVAKNGVKEAIFSMQSKSKDCN